jgi:hypothetical protein
LFQSETAKAIESSVCAGVSGETEVKQSETDRQKARRLFVENPALLDMSLNDLVNELGLNRSAISRARNDLK